MHSEIVSDKRPIESLTRGWGEGADYWRVGYAGIEKIEPYEELGLHCGLPFFRITINGEIRVRVSALECTVRYSPILEGAQEEGRG